MVVDPSSSFNMLNFKSDKTDGMSNVKCELARFEDSSNCHTHNLRSKPDDIIKFMPDEEIRVRIVTFPECSYSFKQFLMTSHGKPGASNL